MKKLIVMMLAICGISISAIAQSASIMGVPLTIPASEFSAQIDSKKKELAEVAKAKKCKIKVNDDVPGSPTMVCCVDVIMEYQPTESDMGYAIIRSLLNEKYGDNTTGVVYLPIPKGGLFWKTPYGEVAITKVSDDIYIRFFNYSTIKAAFGGLSELL